jgi:hypothetical protein
MRTIPRQLQSSARRAGGTYEGDEATDRKRDDENEPRERASLQGEVWVSRADSRGTSELTVYPERAASACGTTGMRRKANRRPRGKIERCRSLSTASLAAAQSLAARRRVRRAPRLQATTSDHRHELSLVRTGTVASSRPRRRRGPATRPRPHPLLRLRTRLRIWTAHLLAPLGAPIPC